MLENRLRTENLTKKELSRIVERIEEIHGIAEQKGYRTLQRETEKAAEELKAVEESIEARKKRTSEELYLSTAGEIEARDVVRRLELSAIERKQLRPDIDRTDVVFAEEDLDNKGIKVEGQGNLDTKETEGYNKNIHSDEAKEHLTESPLQLTETFYKELEKALSGENEENEGVKSDIDYSLLDELVNSGIKCNIDDVVAVIKITDGRLIWLENGNSKAGLEHIMQHVDQFVAKGISRDKISDFVIYALKNGNVVGIQRTRTIYEVLYEGKLQRVAISVGENGFIVGANPKSMPK